MSKKPRVLVASPSYYGKDYCTKKYINAIRSLDYPNYDFIMVDNSPDDKLDYFRKLKRMGVKAFRVKRGKNSREAITNAMNFVRQYFLERNYDYLLVIESDLFPEKDTIQHLMRFGKRVVGSFYLIGHEADNEYYEKARDALKNGEISELQFASFVKSIQPQRACIFEVDKKPNGMIGSRNITIEETVEYFNSGLRMVHGCGLRCTMIKREVVKQFPSWTDNRFGNKHHDVYFYLDLHNAGIPVFVDTSRNIPHMPSRWDEVEDM